MRGVVLAVYLDGRCAVFAIDNAVRFIVNGRPMARFADVKEGDFALVYYQTGDGEVLYPEHVRTARPVTPDEKVTDWNEYLKEFTGRRPFWSAKDDSADDAKVSLTTEMWKYRIDSQMRKRKAKPQTQEDVDFETLITGCRMLNRKGWQLETNHIYTAAMRTLRIG